MKTKSPLSRVTEKQIENSILHYLFYHKIFAWKCNSVGVYDSTKGVYRKPKSQFILSGICDILGIYMGRLLAIEVKVPSRRNNLTEYQKNFIKRVNDNGGLAFVATSIEDVKKELEKEKVVC